MVVSIPTQQGMISFALNAPMLKLIALALGVLIVITGYAVVQLSTFILNATPEQFIRIVLFTAFLIGIFFVARFLLNRKQVKA